MSGLGQVWSVRTAMVRELAALGSAAVLFPLGIMPARNAHVLKLWAAPEAPAPEVTTTPVVLVHGYGGDRSNWLPVEAALGRAGFANVYAMRYSPLLSDVPGIAARLVRDCRTAMAETNSGRVHVVAHSLGGVVLRHAATMLGLGTWLDVGMTVATPHAGAFVARFGRGAVAAALRPGSPLLRTINEAECHGAVRWVSYWSNLDPVVRPWSAVLPGPARSVVNVHIPEEGHLSILRSPVFLADVVQRLRSAEEHAAGSGVRAASGRPLVDVQQIPATDAA
ncbi:esterase/lipase family protein [Blastococcus mobilis]|uniref:Putative serine esterase n=1 Tax=Blastococcus mobilis TaxID=1938746 RepID=A0A238USB2_9ACTN|nr:alpha/beta fold hydrolase [Blastococcus mobilis]SNR24557.1 Putative serine esterase [Blastococcus mobilis]